MRHKNVLVVYSLMQHPPRATLLDALYSFERHSGWRCFYLNMAVRRVPRWLMKVPFDAVIFQTSFLSERWGPSVFLRHLRRGARLKGAGAVRIALPQDEFLRSDLLGEFIRDYGITHVFTVAPESEWDALFASVDRAEVGFERVLTGYLSPETLRRIDTIVEQTSDRPIDIGYRAWHAAPWLGRHGRLKVEVGEAVERIASERDLTVDISTRGSDVLRGDDWYQFLARCKYTLGVEGGSSVHDPSGELKEATEAYVAEHPDASFEEVEATCFSGADGSSGLFAISPRHLEACATRTCQILVEGEYNGILRAGEHYIPLKRDLSNVTEVVKVIESDADRERIVNAAYRDVVASRQYTYESFVKQVDRAVPEGAALRMRPALLALAWRLGRLADRLSWARVALYLNTMARVRPVLMRVLPERALVTVRRVLGGSAVESASVETAQRES